MSGELKALGSRAISRSAICDETARRGPVMSWSRMAASMCWHTNLFTCASRLPLPACSEAQLCRALEWRQCTSVTEAEALRRWRMLS